MATIKPNKKGVVTGTKKADKITWISSKDWKKALTINAGAGNDKIDFKKSKYKNKLNGQVGNDTIWGGTTVDIINGGAGNDKIYGYNGNDSLFAGTGIDIVYGGNGNDKIMGQSGTNTLYGEAGNDTITGGTGNDKIYGGKGNDVINAGKGTNTIYLNKNDGKDIISKGGGKDTVIFAQEKNFGNFTFAYAGNNLNITANGTTAVLKDYKKGGHSVKTVKAGNYSFNNVVTSTVDDRANGTKANDLFIFNGEECDIYTGAGNDILFLNNDDYYVYASQGNNYFNLKNADTVIYLKGMNGNNTIVSDWEDDIELDFTRNEAGSGSTKNEMLRSLALTGDDTYKYVLGQKSGNDLVLKALNNKTVSISNFYSPNNQWGEVDITDFSGNISLYGGFNSHLFFTTPTATLLTGNDTLTGKNNNYIYTATDDIAYNLTLNNSSYNIANIETDANKTVVLNNSNNNYIDTWGGGVVNLTMTGNNNYFYSDESLHSTYSVTGDNNYLELSYINSSTITLNGKNNYADLYIDNVEYEKGMDITINTTGQNEIYSRNRNSGYGSYYYPSAAINYQINSMGNDKFTIGGRWGGNIVNMNFAGSNNTTKFVSIAGNNSLDMKGVLETKKTCLKLNFSTSANEQNVIIHYAGDDFISLADFNTSNMQFRNWYDDNFTSLIKISGAEGQGAADLNTTDFFGKFRVSIYEDSYLKEHSMKDFAQYFDTSNETIAHDFNFGDADMGYMDNLTKDYFVHGTGNTANDEYNDFQFVTGRHTLVDAGGTDALTINEAASDIRMLFDVNADGTLGTDLLFVKASELDKIKNGAITDLSGYLHVANAFTTGKIETVTNEQTELALQYENLTAAGAGSLVAEVAGWLSANGKGSAMEVLYSDDTTAKQALCAFYNTHTDFANNDQNNYWAPLA